MPDGEEDDDAHSVDEGINSMFSPLSHDVPLREDAMTATLRVRVHLRRVVQNEQDANVVVHSLQQLLKGTGVRRSRTI